MPENEDRCPVCRDELKRGFRPPAETGSGPFRVDFCRRCRLGFTRPLPGPEVLERAYGGHSYRVEKGRKFNTFLERLVALFRKRRIRRIGGRYGRAPGRILDFGAGRGLFLNLMKEAGWETVGVELSEETASHARLNYGIEMVSGPPEHWGLEPESFDLITMYHSLEHLSDPLEKLLTLSALLRPGGALLVAVPDVLSLQSRVSRGAWFHLDLPRHLCHLSEEGLRRLFSAVGMEPRYIKRFDLEYGPFGWLQSMLNMPGIRYNLLYDLLGSPAIRGRALREAPGRDIALTVLLAPLLAVPALALSLLEAWPLKRGGAIEVLAVKTGEKERNGGQ